MRFAKEAWPFVLPLLVLAATFVLLGWPLAALVALAIGLAVLLFFRDPRSVFEGDPHAVLAPAYGRVLRVEPASAPEIAEEPMTRIVTFLSVFDVHLQRAPVTGAIVSSSPRRGRRVAAFRSDAGEVNASHLTVMRSATGDAIGVQQIVGLVARRIVCYLRAGDRVERGQTLGLIKFGSRVDLLVPASYAVHVRAGERVRGGETVMARPGASA